MATAGSSSEPKQASPSFFKVVLYPSSPHLVLPAAFVRMYFDEIPKNPILKAAAGEHSWRLKFVKIDGNYCFSHGWEKLVKDAQLCVKDVVVCWLIDPFTFQVSFFNQHGYEKHLGPSSNTNDDHGHADDDGGGDEQKEVMPDEDPCFQKVFSEKTHKYSMALPKQFVEDAGLENTKRIMMKDHEGKEWIMRIMAERYERTKHRLTAGWSIFREYHQFSEGDVCLFKFNKKEGILTLTQVLKSKKPLTTPNVEGPHRKRGRPPREVKIEEDEWKPCGVSGVKVKIENGSGGGPKVEFVKQKTRLKKCVSNVKIEDESGPEMVVVKRKRGRPPLKKPLGGGGGGGAKVKIEDELEQVPEVEVVKRKRGRPPLEKPRGGGVEVRNKGVVYF